MQTFEMYWNGLSVAMKEECGDTGRLAARMAWDYAIGCVLNELVSVVEYYDPEGDLSKPNTRGIIV